MHGFLAYDNGRPVGWCNAASRYSSHWHPVADESLSRDCFVGSTGWVFFASTVYGTEGDTGFVIAVAGAVLFVIGEVGRHSKPAPNPPVT